MKTSFHQLIPVSKLNNMPGVGMQIWKYFVIILKIGVWLTHQISYLSNNWIYYMALGTVVSDLWADERNPQKIH